MSFEEQFPSLKGKSCEPLRFRKYKEISNEQGGRVGYMDENNQPVAIDNRSVVEFSVFSKDDIRKCCLDKQKVKEFVNAAEMLWVVLANVSEGNWSLQSEEWQKAASRWRDNYFKKLEELGL